MKTLVCIVMLFCSRTVAGQPPMPEDRLHVRFSSDVIKAEQEIYLPSLSEKPPRRFIGWKYEFKNGLLRTERSFTGKNIPDTEKYFDYDSSGRLVRDSAINPSMPSFDHYTSYEYNERARLKRITVTNKLTGKPERVEVFKKYNSAGDYQRQTEVFMDEGSLTYTSVFRNGLKQTVIYDKLPSVVYTYDSTGRVTAIGSKKIYYKTDTRGNVIATVAIAYGVRIYEFFRLTYTDGTVTGSLQPDRAFMEEWNKKK